MRSEKSKGSIYKGLGTSGGIAIGKTRIIHNIYNRFRQKISKKNIPSEISKVTSTINELSSEFNEISESLEIRSDKTAAIFETNILILNDPVLRDSINNRIESGFSAEYSINYEFDKQISNILSIGDTYLRERADDLTHLKKMLLNKILNISTVKIKKNDIVIAPSISAGDIYYYHKKGVSGIVSIEGGLTSHASILARAFSIPYMVGVKNALDIEEGVQVILDADKGELFIKPDQQYLNTYKALIKEKSKKLDKNKKIINAKSLTKDGQSIDLSVNIDFKEEVDAIKYSGSQNVGLVRTENLIKSTDLGNSDKQFEIYKEIVEKVYPGNVTFRFLDIGSDKIPTGFINKENNPALGVRGVRFLLHNKSIFKAQIKAFLKASHLKNIKIMIPMITTVDDLKASLKVIRSQMKELDKDGIPYDENIQIGIMLETPSSIMMVDELAKYSDFFSLGTNDLIQYLFASDRTNDNVSTYFNNFHPVLHKLIYETIIKVKSNNKRLSICGEIAYDSRFTRLFTLMGVDELSLSAGHIIDIKKLILDFEVGKNKKVLEKVLNSKDPKKLEKLIQELN